MLPVILLLTGGAICLVSLGQLRKWIKNVQQQAAAAPRRLEAITEELIATAEAASGAVAEKTEQLEAALALAGAAVTELRGLAADAQVSPAAVRTPVSRVREGRPGMLPVQVEPVRFRHARREVRVALPEAPPVPAAAGIPAIAELPSARVSTPQTAIAPPPEGRAASPPDLHRRIYQMADSGQDVTTVARLLSMTKGEVQLVLGLRRMM